MRNLTLLYLVIIGLVYSNCGIDEDDDNTTKCNRAICLTADVGALSTLSANGVIIINLNAQIAKNSDDDKRTISFSTSAGTFVGSGQNTETVLADELGYAYAQMKVGYIPGDYYIKATVGAAPNLYDTTIYITLKPIDIEDAFEFSYLNLQSNPLRADAFSQIQILVKAKDLNFIGKKLSLLAGGGGVFPSNNNTNTIEVLFDGGGLATALMKVGQVVNDYWLTIKIDDPNISSVQTIKLERANPEFVKLDPAVDTIAQHNGTVSITIYLGRGVGKVSDQSIINMEATQLGVPLGSFSPPILFSGIDERAVVTFKTSYSGQILMNEPIIIKASMLNDTGATITDSILLHIQ